MPIDRHLHPAAEAEVEEAADFYARRDPRLAVRFIHTIDQGVEQIVNYPDRYPRYLHGTRRLVIHDFPYALVYREHHGTVQVLAVAHARREPGYWAARVDDPA